MNKYRLVKGEFHRLYAQTRRIGSQPDGDSLWFRPYDKNLLSGLLGRSAGYILTQAVDPHGRPASFVYAGKTAKQDGATVALKPGDLRKTLNAQWLDDGLTYRGDCTSLPTALRDELRERSLTTRSKHKGMWKKDMSLKGATVRTLEELVQIALWPKLFRRLVDCFDTEPVDLTGFTNWLLAKAGDCNDPLLICSRCKFASLHEIVQVRPARFKMLHDPHEIIAVPR